MRRSDRDAVDCLGKQLLYLSETGFFPEGITIVATIKPGKTAVLSTNPLAMGMHMEVMSIEYAKLMHTEGSDDAHPN